MTDSAPNAVLVVDDHPPSLYSTTRVLTAAGFLTKAARTGEEALRLAESPLDLIVLDVNLPDMNGFEVCRRIRAGQPNRQTPIVHLSATFVDDADRVRGLETGADGYLTHPCEPPVLVATVRAFIRARSAEREVRRSETKFRALFDNAVNGIALVSQNLDFVEINPAMDHILGRPHDQILGRNVRDFVPDNRRAEVARIVREVEERDAWRGHLPLMHADGRLVHLDWSISYHSEPDVHVAVLTDISERIWMEDLRQELLASERAARAEADNANRLKDEFLATLSHELRTPLNAILGWAQILRGTGQKPGDWEEGMEAIERSAKAQAQLIGDLLDVSRIISGKLHLETTVLDAAEVVRAAVASVAPAAQAKGIALHQEVGPQVVPVRADANRLQQVVWNLLTNAIKFTPAGGGVTISLRCGRADVVIRVTDTGQGIKQEFLPYMFERFRQQDAAPGRNTGGLGLGLAIVKQLVETHGGTVSAESPGEGKGATFTVTLPIATTLPLESCAEVEDEPETTFLTPLPGVRVLVVDDDADSRTILQRVLSQCQAETQTVASADEAIVSLGTFQPHVLVSDIGMPDRDGYDLIRTVRTLGHSAQTLPAVALTALARREDRQRALRAGYQVHVSKPVEPGNLVSQIASLLGRSEDETTPAS